MAASLARASRFFAQPGALRVACSRSSGGGPLTISPALSSVVLSPTLGSNEKAAAMRAAGQFVCHLGFGESPFPVPRALTEALSRHASAQMYLPTGGLPALQDVATAYYSRVLGVDLGATHEPPVVAPGSAARAKCLRVLFRRMHLRGTRLGWEEQVCHLDALSDASNDWTREVCQEAVPSDNGKNARDSPSAVR